LLSDSLFGDATALCLKLNLFILERLRIRNLWLKVRNALGIYWYWRGFANELRSIEELESITNYNKRRSNCRSKIIDLDLGNGLELAEKVIDEKQPDEICIRYGNFPWDLYKINQELKESREAFTTYFIKRLRCSVA
jgi:hypothetical protein